MFNLLLHHPIRREDLPPRDHPEYYPCLRLATMFGTSMLQSHLRLLSEEERKIDLVFCWREAASLGTLQLVVELWEEYGETGWITLEECARAAISTDRWKIVQWLGENGLDLHGGDERWFRLAARDYRHTRVARELLPNVDWSIVLRYPHQDRMHLYSRLCQDQSVRYHCQWKNGVVICEYLAGAERGPEGWYRWEEMDLWYLGQPDYPWVCSQYLPRKKSARKVESDS